MHRGAGDEQRPCGFHGRLVVWRGRVRNGVGMVAKPGLPILPAEPAINPAQALSSRQEGAMLDKGDFVGGMFNYRARIPHDRRP